LIKNVDAAERFAGGRDVSGDRLAVREIAICGMYRMVIDAQLGLDRFQSFQVACTDRHGGARLREPKRDAAADAARASRNDDAFAIEIEPHVFPSRSLNQHVTTADKRRPFPC
jgi:hypothetical protein